TRRHSYMGYGGTKEYVQALKDIVVAMMIEKKGAVDELEEILSIPGVDMVQWGGADFSMSIGKAGERNLPEVVAARNKVFKTAIKMGVAPRAEIQSPDQAKEFLDMGVRHFSIGTDVVILFNYWKENGDKLRKALEGH
ncbi:MAG: aldolase/citrate lyase family protein, partial [Chloroflexota bacterium]|nr:aldolase/citrate lyase family protein [Chloroflexota bacterium]